MSRKCFKNYLYAFVAKKDFHVLFGKFFCVRVFTFWASDLLIVVFNSWSFQEGYQLQCLINRLFVCCLDVTVVIHQGSLLISKLEFFYKG